LEKFAAYGLQPMVFLQPMAIFQPKIAAYDF
jgi:hypothetical protein